MSLKAVVGWQDAVYCIMSRCTRDPMLSPKGSPLLSAGYQQQRLEATAVYRAAKAKGGRKDDLS